MKQDWYPEQRQAFIDALLSIMDRMPPQAGLTTDHSCQDIEYALHQIGCRDPNHRMIGELTALNLELHRVNPDIPERIFGWVYDRLCEEYGRVGDTKVGYFFVQHDHDPFHTTSGHVERELRRMMTESFPRATEIQVREAAAKIRRRFEQDPARPLDHSHDAWRRQANKGKRHGKA